jgi:hypothetical protein
VIPVVICVGIFMIFSKFAFAKKTT